MVQSGSTRFWDILGLPIDPNSTSSFFRIRVTQNTTGFWDFVCRIHLDQQSQACLNELCSFAICKIRHSPKVWWDRWSSNRPFLPCGTFWTGLHAGICISKKEKGVLRCHISNVLLWLHSRPIILAYSGQNDNDIKSLKDRWVKGQSVLEWYGVINLASLARCNHLRPLLRMFGIEAWKRSSFSQIQLTNGARPNPHPNSTFD